MTPVKNDLVRLINTDEPDYQNILKMLTEEDVPELVRLALARNTSVASKAISCLAYFSSPEAVKGLEKAASSKRPVLRLAVAYAMGHREFNMDRKVNIIGKLLQDKDTGVRKFAIKAVQSGHLQTLSAKVKRLSETEENPALKKMAEGVWKKIK